MPIMIFMTRYYNSPIHPRRIVSVPNNLFTIFLLSLSVMLAVFAGSCKKEVLTSGGDILPSGDFVTLSSIDTLSVFSYTRYTDSTRTDKPSFSYLGQLSDPYFGTTTAGFVSQIRLNSKWDPRPFTVDSMKLVLHVLSNSGAASDAVHTLNISEIDDQIFTDSAYYSISPIRTNGFKMNNIVLPAMRSDTINNIELPLPGNGVELGQWLTRDTTMLFYNNNKPDFRSYFKGFYFQLTPGSDPFMFSLSLVYNLTTYYNYFVLFIHYDDGTNQQYSFILDAKNLNAAFNVYKHDYTTATLGDKMEHRNTSYIDTLSYLQSLNGVYTKVTLPGLEKIKKDALLGKIAVNKARLVVPVHFTPTGTTPYISTSVPSQLVLRYQAVSTGIKYPVTDYLLGYPTPDQTHNFFDGKLDSIAKVYNFNIPAFIQSYLDDATGDVKPELEIYQGPGTRDVILETNKSKTPVKFEFTYTKF